MRCCQKPAWVGELPEENELVVDHLLQLVALFIYSLICAFLCCCCCCCFETCSHFFAIFCCFLLFVCFYYRHHGRNAGSTIWCRFLFVFIFDPVVFFSFMTVVICLFYCRHHGRNAGGTFTISIRTRCCPRTPGFKRNNIL